MLKRYNPTVAGNVPANKFYIERVMQNGRRVTELRPKALHDSRESAEKQADVFRKKHPKLRYEIKQAV